MSGSPALVAIVGSGELARAHARVAVAHPDLRLVALIGTDEQSGQTLADDVVNRFEGERPRLFPDLAAALDATAIHIVAISVPDDASGTATAAVRAGTAVVGGRALPDGDAATWFPFDAGPSDGRSADDVAFADHLRQYEGIIGQIGFGPLADQAGARS